MNPTIIARLLKFLTDAMTKSPTLTKVIANAIGKGKVLSTNAAVAAQDVVSWIAADKTRALLILSVIPSGVELARSLFSDDETVANQLNHMSGSSDVVTMLDDFDEDFRTLESAYAQNGGERGFEILLRAIQIPATTRALYRAAKRVR